MHCGDTQARPLELGRGPSTRVPCTLLLRLPSRPAHSLSASSLPGSVPHGLAQPPQQPSGMGTAPSPGAGGQVEALRSSYSPELTQQVGGRGWLKAGFG